MLAFSLSNDDLWKLHPWGAWLDAFDISPDGQTFAAEFEALQSRQEAAMWVGEWSIATRRLIAERPIEGPAPREQLLPSPPNPAQYSFDLRFTPDGQRLIALTGPVIRALDAKKLRVLYSVSPGEIHAAPSDHVVLRRFLVSGDSKLLVVFSSPATYPWRAIECRQFNLETGELVARWGLPWSDAASISLSPDSSELLMSRIESDRPRRSDIVLLDARTGKELRTVGGGFASRGWSYGGQAEFLTDECIVVAATTSLRHSHVALKIVNTRTDKAVRELSYAKDDVDTWFVVATRKPVIAALIFSWKWGIGSDLDDPFRRWTNRLALFNAGQSEPFYVRRKVRLLDGGGPSAFTGLRQTLRISSDGNVMALGEAKNINVYRVEPTATLGKVSD
jgi:hypothetical protein